tara:strand:+ start:6150 stop:7490 length:1341 start_codon:yes stop_codon:yes gene_type:complete
MIPEPKITSPEPFVLPQVDKWQTSNGLKVEFVEVGIIPKVYFLLSMNFGSADELNTQVGIYHLISDYLKEGTTDLDGNQVADKAASLGGRFDVNVHDDNLTITGSVLTEFAAEFIELIGAITINPLFPTDSLERLRGDMHRDLELMKVQPGVLASAAFRRALYGNSGYGLTLSTPEIIDTFSIQDVSDSYRKFANPYETKLYVAGMFDKDVLKNAIENTFCEWSGDLGEHIARTLPDASRKIHLLNRKNSEQSTLAIGLPVITPKDTNYVPLAVMNALLGGSFYSRITLNIREDKGYTYSPRSMIASHPTSAYWVETADVTTNVTGASIEEIFKEINLMRDTEPSNEELDGIKNYVSGSYIMRHTTPGAILGQLAFLDLHNLDEEWAKNYIAHVVSLEPSDIQKTAQQYLDPSVMTIAVVGDGEMIREEITSFAPIEEITVESLLP